MKTKKTPTIRIFIEIKTANEHQWNFMSDSTIIALEMQKAYVEANHKQNKMTYEIKGAAPLSELAEQNMKKHIGIMKRIPKEKSVRDECIRRGNE